MSEALPTQSTTQKAPKDAAQPQGRVADSTSPVLDPATRPSLASTPAVSQVSHIAQAPSTAHTPPSTNTSSATPSAVVTPATETQIDPDVAGLQAMFPDFDVLLLESVLEASGGDFERAVDMLLGMSDPNYKSQAPPPPQQTQEDLDEQLARRLLLEEQQQYQYEQVYNEQPPAHPQVPYQVRQHHPPPHGNAHEESSMGADLRDQFMSFINNARGAVSERTRSGPSGSGVGPGAGATEGGQGPDFRQQFNQFAETGKQTFASLVTKVKTKLQEFEQPPGENQGRHSHQQEHWSTWTSAPPPSNSLVDDPIPAQQSQSRSLQRGASQRQDPYSTQSAQGMGGYQVNNTLNPGLSSAVHSTAAPVTTGPVISKTEPAVPAGSLNAPGGTGGPSETARPSFDTSRLGLKPKRPVSLVNVHNEPEPTEQARRKDSDADSLEYVTSPFEDR
ncbi:hypothetical protein FRC02_001024 [Tulasnella sp. 418]|nr:hypothetical protein FRC02_001024 [Tulasnella sp. 418]